MILHYRRHCGEALGKPVEHSVAAGQRRNDETTATPYVLVVSMFVGVMFVGVMFVSIMVVLVMFVVMLMIRVITKCWLFFH